LYAGILPEAREKRAAAGAGGSAPGRPRATARPAGAALCADESDFKICYNEEKSIKGGSMRRFIAGVSCVLCLGAAFSAHGAAIRGVRADRDVPSGILYDRVLPLSGIERFDGRAGSETLGRALWDQIYHELHRASEGVAPATPPRAFVEGALKAAGPGRVPVALLNIRYHRIRPDAFERGLLSVQEGRLVATGEDPYDEERAFAACALRCYTHRGARVTFSFDDRWYVTNDRTEIRTMEADFDDGAGFRSIEMRGDVVVRYEAEGSKRIALRAAFVDGSVLESSFAFVVRNLETPMPTDTLAVTATILYEGSAGTGEAYVYRSPLNERLANPVIVIEGFDLDNTMNWDELFGLLNQQHLADTLNAQGYDLVLLNFTDATDYIQRNAYVVVELIEQVLAAIDPGTGITVVGPSMGGLAGRYALAYMETAGLPHRTRAFISFDGPHRGADIPLGMQYWVKFFSAESASAAFLLERLDTPAARQMLLYHYTDPAGSTGTADPLRAAFLADLESAGGYPQEPRLVAVANGSGGGSGQGFAPGEQVIRYEYSSLLVSIIGNVWAVPDETSTRIFRGVIDRIWPYPDDALQVTVSGTEPLDCAPGGWRNSMQQMDETEAPYGDIVALHPNHCFIPTVSALDVDTDDLFHHIAEDPEIMSRTPFDTIYYPATNEEHVTITAASAEWFLAEIRRPVVTAVDDRPIAAFPALHQNYPNPFNPSTVVSFDLASRGRVRIGVYDILGRRVATIADRVFAAGRHRLAWDGRDDGGRPLASGVYFCRLDTGERRETKKMVLAR
jgi:hypothetical protein